jgi:hypothetical protein
MSYKNTQLMVIASENRKLDYIERLVAINGDINREMETLISNFIDYTCEQQFSEAEKCKMLIKEKQPGKFEKILDASNSIIYNYDLVIYIN